MYCAEASCTPDRVRSRAYDRIDLLLLAALVLIALSGQLVHSGRTSESAQPHDARERIFECNAGGWYAMPPALQCCMRDMRSIRTASTDDERL
jgi:hypothetical protein